VLLDANALLLPVRVQFPLESELQRIAPEARPKIPSSVVEELGRLADRGVRGARAAAELAQRFPVLKVEGRGDAAILEAAVDTRSWVVTADRALVERLRDRGVNVLVPRDRHRLELRPARPVRVSTDSRSRRR